MTNTSPDRVLRGAAAAAVNAAPLAMELGRSRGVPEELLAQARGAARAEGYAAGWAQGRRDAAEQAGIEAQRTADAAHTAAADRVAAVGSALDALARAAEGLEQRSAPVLAEAEDVVADAAFRLAEAIVGRELATAQEPGRDAVRRALALLPAGRPVIIRLHPDDHAELLRIVGDDAEIDGRRITFVADPSLAAGDATADCDATRVDARIQTALARAREVLQP